MVSTEAEEEKKEEINESEIKKIVEDVGFKYERLIGKGGYGRVVEVKKDNRIFAIKIIFERETKNNKKDIKIEPIKELRGKNIVKINFEYTELLNQDKEKKYYFYAMECSFIGCLNDFHRFINNKLIFKGAFVEKVGDNLTRFFVLQMVTALKTLYQGNFVHYDIKPDNMLIRKGLNLKLIDFSFLTKLSGESGKIPGGTLGYITPEYFNKTNSHKNETLRKQDYFAIGMTIFFLKYGIGSLNDFSIKDDENAFNKHKIVIESIENARDKIKNQLFQDEDFTQFLCNLIQLRPEDRLDFEEIIRNKWLNKNTKEIQKIYNINESDEDNIVLELQKSDFLINNRKYYRKNFDKKYSNEIENKKYRQLKKGKFKFGKRN